MKKAFLFACALFGATFAHAVTINWSAGSGFAGINATGSVEMTINFVALETTPLGADTMFKVGNLNFGGNSELSIQKGNDESTRIWAQGDFSDARLTANATENFATNSMTFYFTVSDDGTTWTASQYQVIFANGDKEGPKNFSSGNEGRLILSADEINAWTDFTDGTMTVTSVTFKGDNVAVPEPTALALLALGVAGVALRRKKTVA